MTREDILILAKAGFNANQIAALSSVQNQQATAPQVTAPQNQQNSGVDDVLKKLSEMNNALFSQNMGNAAMPQAQSADEVLAQIIAPNTNGGE